MFFISNKNINFIIQKKINKLKNKQNKQKINKKNKKQKTNKTKPSSEDKLENLLSLPQKIETKDYFPLENEQPSIYSSLDLPVYFPKKRDKEKKKKRRFKKKKINSSFKQNKTKK